MVQNGQTGSKKVDIGRVEEGLWIFETKLGDGIKNGLFHRW